MFSTVSVNNQKFILLVLGLVAVTVLMIVGTIEQSLGFPTLSGIIFYAIGNGVGAKAGVDTALVRRREDDPVVVTAPATVKVVQGDDAQ